IRRENFRLYLRHMQARRPKTMLVMEAPGYRGCRLTGVPVTSRKVLLEGVPELDFFGEEKGYHLTHDPEFENVYGEQSATIVWGTLAQLGHLPLIWNTFPFHPHKAGKPLTNRPPRAPEKALGAHFLEAMLTLFQPKQVIAIGNVAHDTLSKIGLECAKVRHPAQGGKNDFVAGLTELLGN
ncbi:MAG: uracil-DNA glycosylase, partial [Anaerolineae bacterium]|nr:uracil-DNA glycosylase [Anaerolineae bacterium]